MLNESDSLSFLKEVSIVPEFWTGCTTLKGHNSHVFFSLILSIFLYQIVFVPFVFSNGSVLSPYIALN